MCFHKRKWESEESLLKNDERKEQSSKATVLLFNALKHCFKKYFSTFKYIWKKIEVRWQSTTKNKELNSQLLS